MADEPKDAPNQTRRNIALGSAAVVGMGATLGVSYLSGTLVRDQKRRNIVPELAKHVTSGIDKGDFSATGGALATAKRYGILNEVVNAMAPNTALAEVNPASASAEDVEMRARFHLKNLRSAVDMRSAAQAYTALTDARREHALDAMIDQIAITIAQDRPR